MKSGAFLTEPGDLLKRLRVSLPEKELSACRKITYPFKVSRSFFKKIKAGDLSDPLLRQVLPDSRELKKKGGFSADPLGEKKALSPGLSLKKYKGRLLLLVNNTCPMHCRFCFRRELPMAGRIVLGTERLKRLGEEISGDPSLYEVVLSGGDPLMAGRQDLARICGLLGGAHGLKAVRVHTRVPSALPERITREFISPFKGLKQSLVLVSHVNHSRELDTATGRAFTILKQAGFQLLNQSVLLKGINDDLQALKELSETLFSQGVLPYYLHSLDRVKGSGHFQVKKGKVLKLVKKLRNEVPGYLVPRLVREEPGRLSKTIIC